MNSQTFDDKFFQLGKNSLSEYSVVLRGPIGKSLDPPSLSLVTSMFPCEPHSKAFHISGVLFFAYLVAIGSTVVK